MVEILVGIIVVCIGLAAGFWLLVGIVWIISEACSGIAEFVMWPVRIYRRWSVRTVRDAAREKMLRERAAEVEELFIREQ